MSRPLGILVIEDDPAIRRGLVDALKFDSFQVFEADTAARGAELAASVECDAVLLDLLLPGGDGISILQAIRAARPTLPVLILTARGDEADRIRGLQLGADDYIVKPFSIRELLARLRAVLRRSPARPLDVASVQFPAAEMCADLLRRELRFADGDRQELSEKETELLRYLACNHQRAVSREELLRGVWQIEARRGETRTIDMHVARLREKMRDAGDHPRSLLTVRGKGYMLAPDAQITGSRS
jgi:DNA-binding response OmpR family regulator